MLGLECKTQNIRFLLNQWLFRHQNRKEMWVHILNTVPFILKKKNVITGFGDGRLATQEHLNAEHEDLTTHFSSYFA
jgi:hypothetical protein